VRTCQKLRKVVDALWTFLETEGIESTNNAAERALRPAVIQRKVSHGVQSADTPAHHSTTLDIKEGMSRSSWSRAGLPITPAG
jgi:hypothetical protein